MGQKLKKKFTRFLFIFVLLIFLGAGQHSLMLNMVAHCTALTYFPSNFKVALKMCVCPLFFQCNCIQLSIRCTSNVSGVCIITDQNLKSGSISDNSNTSLKLVEPTYLFFNQKLFSKHFYLSKLSADA